jgi:DNA-binding transcriptional LysR family regulator
VKFNIQNFDLNLLAIFDALMVERNVSKAAARVFLSQSAMSHALNRLRGLLDDPILVRTEKGMRPTPRALDMEVPIREALTRIQQTLYEPAVFDPLTSDETFTLYGPEYYECVFLPILAKRLVKIAPNVKIITEILSTEVPESELSSGEVDFSVGVESGLQISKRLHCQSWCNDRLTCLVRKENKNVGDRISLEEFTQIPHVYHSTLGTPFKFTFLDEWLQENNLSRKFAFTIPGYMAAGMTIAETDYLMTLPLRLAQKLVQIMKLRIVMPPESFPEYRLNLIWHPLYEMDPARVWFRDQLLDLANQVRENCIYQS